MINSNFESISQVSELEVGEMAPHEIIAHCLSELSVCFGIIEKQFLLWDVGK